MTWWINLTDSTGTPRVWNFATDDEAAQVAAEYVARGWTLVTAPVRREDSSFTPPGLAALADLIRLEDDRGAGRISDEAYAAAQAKALAFGYGERELAIASDWFTGHSGTWEETVAFLDDPYTREWLARMVAAGWASYDVNHRPVTEEHLRRLMTAWPRHQQDECLAWAHAEEIANHRFEGPTDALGRWICRDIDPADDEPGGEQHVFVRRYSVGAATYVSVVIAGTIPLAQATARYGHCRTVEDLNDV
jgi:hypothetical protein